MQKNQSIKERLIQEINTIEDARLLQELLEMVEMEKKMYSMDIHEMNPVFEEELLAIYKRVKGGQFYTDKQINDETEEWLNQ